MALQKKFITVFASVLSASVFFACSESKLDGSPTGTVDANASSSSTSDVGTCNVSNINDIKFVAAENMYYRCDGLTWVQQSSSSVASSSSNTSGVNVFATLEDLPNCTASRKNQLAVVSVTNTPYICTDGRWVVYGTSSSSSSAECGDEDKVWKAEGGKYYECIDGEWVEGSSSSVESSSSSTSSSSVDPGKTYGEILDTRDGQVYKTIEICDKNDENCQTWMAENLNYAYTGVKYNGGSHTSDSTSWCYGGDPSNCGTYGRLYTWAAAVDSVAIYQKYGEECGYGKSCPRFSASALATTPVRGVCPSGWHLPSNAEWSTLYKNVGGTSNTGTDEYGVSVLPAGRRLDNGNFHNRSSYAYFWSSTEYEGYSNFAWSQNFFHYRDDVRQHSNKNYGFSVRCLKDSF